MLLLEMVVFVLGLSGLVLLAGMLAYRSPRTAALRIREERERRLKGSKLARAAVLNSILSVAIVLGAVVGFYDGLFYEATPSAMRLGLEVGGVLLVYDVLYYLTHRFAFHQWSVLKGVHAVHHTARYPQAIDALYVHPIETMIGLGLLFLSTYLVGPVSVWGFGVIFLVYSLLNILIHAGLSVPAFPLRAVSYMARKHDKHHVSMQGGNYASITPLCDLIFGTAE